MNANEKTPQQVMELIKSALAESGMDFSKIRASGSYAAFNIRLQNGQEFRLQLAETID